MVSHIQEKTQTEHVEEQGDEEDVWGSGGESDRRVMHDEALHDLYAHIFGRDRQGMLHMEETRNAYRVFVGKHEGKSLFGRPRHRWEDNM